MTKMALTLLQLMPKAVLALVVVLDSVHQVKVRTAPTRRLLPVLALLTVVKLLYLPAAFCVPVS